MMNYFSNRKKWMAYLILLTFVFTCIVPTNIGGGNSIAEANTGISAQSSEEDSIKFKLFNYGPEINYNHDESGNRTTMRAAASGGYFGFSGAEDDELPFQYKPKTLEDDQGNITRYDELQFGHNHATVERVLGNDGYPVLDFRNAATGADLTEPPETVLPIEDRSLKYLFTAGDHAVTAYKLTNSLVSPNAEGYYEYNSTNNAVDLCTPSAAIAGGGYGESAIAIKTDKELTTSSYNEYASEQVETYKDFLPFTNPNSDQTNYISHGTNDNYPKQINGRKIIDDKTYLYDASQVDYWFGMTMETKFMQPEDGKVTDKQGNLQDMVFEFAGDDDVWVFIDDVLVLDLGGAHGVVKGSINFATGVVEQYDTYNRIKSEVDTDGNGYAQNTKCYTTTIKDCFDLAGKLEGKNLSDYFEFFEENGETHYRFNDFSTHTINFFYMERYTGSANCHLKFNLMLADTERTATKVWQDDENRDGKRPDSITVRLTGDNGYTTESALSLANNWTVKWPELQKYHDQESVKTEAAQKNECVNGDLVEYTIEELDAPQGNPIVDGDKYNDYMTTYSYSEENHVMTITNTYEPEKISISGKKTWNDADDQDGKRPDYITVNLLADGVEVAEKEVKESDNWEYTFDGENLWKYKDGGTEIVYTVTEDEVYGYTNEITGYDITNTHVPETINIPVEKVWNDKNNQDGKRSDITVELLADGDETGKTLALTEANNWSGIFENVDKYANKQEIVYSLKEVNVPNGYTSEITGDKVNGFVVTNSRDTEKTSVSGYKTWADNDDAAGKRPDKINVWLLADGVRTTSQAVTYDANDVWFYSFTDLDKYRDGGQEIVYSVEEEPVTDYQPVYDKNSYNIRNVYEKDEDPFIQIKGIKTWLNDKPEQRPENVTIELLQNGKVTTSQAITAAMDWEYDFGTHPKYDDQGKPYTYTVREKDVPEGYVSMVSGFDITNTLHSGEIGQFTVEKDVTGTGTPPAGTQFGFRLSLEATEILWNEALEKELNGLKAAYDTAVTARDKIEKELLPSAVNDFMTNAKVYSTGSAYLFVMKADTSSPSVYQYTAVDKNNRMEVSTSSALSFFDEKDRVDAQRESTVLGVVVETIKGLADEFATLGNRASVFLQTLKSELGEMLNAVVQFEKDDVDKLLRIQNQLFDAQVRVDATSDAVYQFEQKASTPSAVTLVVKDMSGNVRDTIEMDLEDLNDRNSYSPNGTLLHDGGKFYLADGEQYSFIVMAADGVTLKYTIVEEDYATENYQGTEIKRNGIVVDNYPRSIEGSIGNAATDSIVFKNIYEKSGGGGGDIYISRTVEKVWNDNNNPNRPSSITVNLLRDGKVFKTVTLSEADGWSYNWSALADGSDWTVEEVNVAEGYKVGISESGNTFTITNTLTTLPTPTPDPEETIPDEDVPTGSVEPGEPLDELDDPEIPLGDAPATGDTNNAAPFMALLLAAIAGLVITRRKFN